MKILPKNSILNSNSNAGFTLIELLISTTLIVLLMLAISSMFMTFLLGNSKTNSRRNIKEEGLHAISQMEFLIKNAQYVDESSFPCNPVMSQLDIVSLDGGVTSLTLLQDSSDGNHYKIASNSAFLTSSSVNVVSGPTFNCSGEVGNRQIIISFELQKTTPDGIITEEFNSIVNGRN